ncbi:MAG: IS200/IS605 family element RNA-guided endonuclease TnpB [Oscillospiraceae bacterium]|nr:IS200/IS605 family element RNA-guided endonuclease TnpB [Oscillospiraceae bacterium]
MVEKAYRFRWYPNDDQKVLTNKTFGCKRHIYNRYLEKRSSAYKNDGYSLKLRECDKDMTKYKEETAWLKEVDSTALQAAIQDLDQAYQNFFSSQKKGDKKFGYPQPKSKHDNRQSYRSKNNGNTIRLEGECIRIPKLGLIRYAKSKEVQGRILNATISRVPNGKYYISLCCTDVEEEMIEKTGSVNRLAWTAHELRSCSSHVGIDLGLKDFATDSNGEKYENHKHYRENESKMKRAQRRLSRKPKGSSNRNKARIRLATIHETIKNRRMDDLHKLSHKTVKENDIICIEDLNVKGMKRNHKLSKSVSDVGWGEFARQLEYKCKWRGKTLVKIDRFYPSTQLCNECGFKNEALKGKEGLNIREWLCPNCGAMHDRDINAARNILKEGLRLYKESI